MYCLSTLDGAEYVQFALTMKSWRVILSFSATSVSRDSSSNNFPCVERRDDNIKRADLICLSQTPPMWLGAGWLLIYFTKSPPRLWMKYWILSLSIFCMFTSVDFHIQQSWYHYLSIIPFISSASNNSSKCLPEGFTI